MSTETATSPVGGEGTAEEAILETEMEVETEGEVETEPQFDEDGNPIEEPDEDEEVELDDDLKLKVPKSQAQKVREAMLRQADYTRKTQELAEARRTFDTERQNIAQATNQELALFADATSLGRELATFQKVDWNAWHQQAQATYDPDEVAKVQSAFMRYQQVKDLHANTVNQLSQLENQRKSASQQETAKRVEEGRAVLAREIGWNDELKAKLTDYALGQGLSREDLSDLEATPAAAKILRDAYEGHLARQKATAANRHVQAQQAQPAATVKAKSAPPVGLDDRLSIDEWQRRREKQVRNKA